jgi:hypothetical protein
MLPLVTKSGRTAENDHEIACQRCYRLRLRLGSSPGQRQPEPIRHRTKPVREPQLQLPRDNSSRQCGSECGARSRTLEGSRWMKGAIALRLSAHEHAYRRLAERRQEAARRPILATVRVTRTTARPKYPVNAMAINATTASMSPCSTSVILLNSSTSSKCIAVITSLTDRNAVGKWVDVGVCATAQPPGRFVAVRLKPWIQLG